MRVLMLSKACIVGIYQRKLEAIARLGVDLLALVPPSWRDERGKTRLERAFTAGYRLEVIPIALNGSFHAHFYPGLGGHIRRFRPHIVHIDEEPYNLSAWQALFHARRASARSLFFSWQNILRRYPPPFAWGERWLLRGVDHALVGTDSAGAVWRAKGYTGPLTVIPQFGIDTDLFRPDTAPREADFTVGYVGRLVPEKGVQVLLEAAARMSSPPQVRIIGSGPERAALIAQADRLGLSPRVTFIEWLPSTEMPAQYRQFDVLAVPSLTRPNWKEQFGRVILEAMASGVPVIGSDSGAIPDILGGAGLTFPEGNPAALASHLERLRADPALRDHLCGAGRARVVDHFTHEQVAAATVAVYGDMLAERDRSAT